MFIKKCMQTFMMDEKEVVLVVFIGERGQFINVYAVPVEIADELKIDEHEGSAVELGEGIMEQIADFELEKKYDKKLPYLTLETLW